MFLFIFNSYSSGLSYYYFIATLITILQTWIIRKFVDDKKLLKQIELAKTKTGKEIKIPATIGRNAENATTKIKRATEKGKIKLKMRV